MAGRTIEREREREKKIVAEWNKNSAGHEQWQKPCTLEVDLFSRGTTRGVNRARIEVQSRPAV